MFWQLLSQLGRHLDNINGGAFSANMTKEKLTYDTDGLCHVGKNGDQPVAEKYLAT
jgi:hypothetical protein